MTSYLMSPEKLGISSKAVSPQWHCCHRVSCLRGSPCRFSILGHFLSQSLLTSWDCPVRSSFLRDLSCCLLRNLEIPTRFSVLSNDLSQCVLIHWCHSEVLSPQWPYVIASPENSVSNWGFQFLVSSSSQHCLWSQGSSAMSSVLSNIESQGPLRSWGSFSKVLNPCWLPSSQCLMSPISCIPLIFLLLNTSHSQVGVERHWYR